jgi:polar amino acid transport system permease protein
MAHADGEMYQREYTPLLTDATAKRLGAIASGLFGIGIVALMVYILVFNDRSAVNLNDLLGYVGRFVDPFLLVLRIVLISSITSIVSGILVGLARVSSSPITSRVGAAYVEFFRGTPLLFQLMLIFYGIPALWPVGGFPFPNFAVPAAIIGLTLNHAAYIGEAVRGGIDSVPSGQMEAARSLGMSYVQSMREVVLPQAWRNALAAIGNDLVILVKDTSLLTIIAVPEIISQMRNLQVSTFDVWGPLVMVAILYLMITIPLGKLVRYAEARADPAGNRR